MSDSISIDLRRYAADFQLGESGGHFVLRASGHPGSLPLKRQQLPLARALVQHDGEFKGSFDDAAYAQLAGFYFLHRGSLSPFVNYDSLLPDVGSNTPLRPRELSIILTKFCNLRCLHCYNDSAVRDVQEPTSDEKLELLDYAARWGVRLITLSGGEPTLDPCFPAVLANAAKLGLVVKVSTNGWNLPAPLLEAVRAGTVVQLNVSLDGADAETHDYLRHRQGSFVRVMRSLEELRLNKPRVLVLNASIHQRSLNQMERMTQIGVAVGADVISFKAITHTGRKRGEETFLLNPEQVSKFRRTRDELRHRYRHSIEIDGKLITESIRAEMRDQVSCQAGELAMVINADGRALPCDSIEGVPGAPDFREYPLMYIWREHHVFSQFRQVRAQAKGGGCGTGGCPAHAARSLLSGQYGEAAPAANYIPLSALFSA